MCNHQFLFHARMNKKNVRIMSWKYDSQSVFVIWLPFYDSHDNLKMICVFSCEKWWNEKKKWLQKKSEHTVSFFFNPWKFFWKIGQLAQILWNRVLIMLFWGKEFRKFLAATETAAEINEDYFQQDHQETDDDDVPPLYLQSPLKMWLALLRAGKKQRSTKKNNFDGPPIW